jgi:hypothetical protein
MMTSAPSLLLRIHPGDGDDALRAHLRGIRAWLTTESGAGVVAAYTLLNRRAASLLARLTEIRDYGRSIGHAIDARVSTGGSDGMPALDIAIVGPLGR